ncbi:HigA family addiction module antitoxin [Geminocystis sp. CENA526]|uniref:HigA family addiction module antitoxin n=1 Tax=Geminocystis sp. CENA526 TaxID=1355871 RepID=UPI003D6E6279
MTDWKKPIHPGEILADELEEIGLNASQLADIIGVPKNRIYQILNGQRNLTADTALRLGKFFDTGAKLWLNLQKNYELDVASQNLNNQLDFIIPYHKLKQHLSLN